MNIADESDEVANLRVEKTKSRRRIGLRMRRIGKVADCFEADHCGDFIAACSASAGVNETSHLTGQKIRRFLLHKNDEAHRVVWGSSHKTTRQGKGCRHPRALIVFARGAQNPIDVRTRHAKLRRARKSRPLFGWELGL